MRAGLATLQVRARTAGYLADWPRAKHSIVLAAGVAVGRVLVDEHLDFLHRDVLHIVDLRIAAARRGQGIGAAVLRALASSADRTGATLTLSVDHGNRATELYRRAGFAMVGGDELSGAWERRPVTVVPG